MYEGGLPAGGKEKAVLTNIEGGIRKRNTGFQLFSAKRQIVCNKFKSSPAGDFFAGLFFSWDCEYGRGGSGKIM
ncbi:MAG: hypothetical protein K2P87_11370 [Lachnospiraceae bacterium]|nr:hypothetical protein [Lachnospiraceae bacterium]